MSGSDVRATFFIRRQNDDLLAAVAETLQAIAGPARGDRVFVKPNFTYPFEKAGVTTTRHFLVALIEALRDRGAATICVGEGEGGYNAFSMNSTFKAFRLDDLRARYAITYANVNHWPSHDFLVEDRGRSYTVRFPAPILTEFDSYISVPVPKVHCMTTISGAVKNQWGLVQDTMRLRFHCAFEAIASAIVEALPHGLAICDGTYGLTRNGPMVDGETLELGWVAGSNNLWLHDIMLSRLMRVRPSTVAHLQHAIDRGLTPSMDRCDLSTGWEDFIDDRFYLQRNAWNRLARLAWHSPAINHLAYTSRASAPLHKAMYAVRKKSPDLLARGVDWH